MATESLKSERPETLVSYAARRIRESLTSGEFTAGERLSPSKLAEDYGLSHIPVREALSSLAATGYVVHDRGRGYFVRELTSEDLEDIYRLRKLLEAEAYRQGVPNLTNEDIDSMENLVARMGRRLGSEDREEYVALNREFHFIPFRRSGSRRLVRFLNFLWDSAEPYAHLGSVASDHGHADHIRMMEVLKTRNADAVIDLMDEHRRLRIADVEGWEQTKDGTESS